MPAKRSVFNITVGEAKADGLELAFAAFLVDAYSPDGQAFVGASAGIL